MDVGVRDLKQNLSKYLDRAARGEVIRVTDRGKPKAVIGPLPDRSRLDRGIAEGWITAAEGCPARRVGRERSRRQVADILAEDRDE